ncbi:helicase [Alicyclobacillaceae bacterium I2511]|nr:helicase [Alicyclobacillaceae bacterium I2511]
MFVRKDGSVWIPETASNEVINFVASFAERVTDMGSVQVFHITPVSLWEAAANGRTARDILRFLKLHCSPENLSFQIQEKIVVEMGKWGCTRLTMASDKKLFLQICPRLSSQVKALAELPQHRTTEDGLVFDLSQRATVKRVLARSGIPVLDKTGYTHPPQLCFSLSEQTHLRDYQQQAVDYFLSSTIGGSGVAVLPCGSGKTLVGIATAQKLQATTLILVPNETSALQWQKEFYQRTTLKAPQVGSYQPKAPLRPVTLVTYHRVASRSAQGQRMNFQHLLEQTWGLVIYDEVHMLPAPWFRLAAELQGSHRLGLTATLVREDGAQADVFSLIGPKFYDQSWRALEQAGFLSRVRCVEVRIPMDATSQALYGAASARERHKIAAQNPQKLPVVRSILKDHEGQSVLLMGQYLEGLRSTAQAIGCPLIEGKTPRTQRERLFSDFRQGKCLQLAVSRIANAAVDLPTASVAIQVSGLFGSRQEEAQRIGRLLRPDTKEGIFYSLVSEATVEEKMAAHRQTFLAEQGYAYDIRSAAEILAR